MSDQLSALVSSAFVDLYIGDSFADVKGLAGVEDSRVAVPCNWLPEVEALRKLCRERLQSAGIPEFSIIHEAVVYRVTHLDGIDQGGVFVLRRSSAQLRDCRSIGLPSYALSALLEKNATGLVLICGGMGVGKTTTAASIVVERLNLHGGMALAIEDPTETNINGVHGKGRCIAISASRYTGGYKEHLVRGLRSGVDFFFIGEIRDDETAFEALKAGSNGKFIIATLHAGNIPQALERLITLASQYTDTAAETLADSLLAVVWQNLEDLPRQGGGTVKRLTTSTLVIGRSDGAIREKIRRGELPSIEHEIERQASQKIWGIE